MGQRSVRPTLFYRRDHGRSPYSSDPLTGTQHYVEYDSGADAIHWTSEQEVRPLVAINREMYNDAPARWREGQHVAILPNIFVLKLMREGIWATARG